MSVNGHHVIMSNEPIKAKDFARLALRMKFIRSVPFGEGLRCEYSEQDDNFRRVLVCLFITANML